MVRIKQIKEQQGSGLDRGIDTIFVLEEGAGGQ